jgi:hypothetical protein
MYKTVTSTWLSKQYWLSLEWLLRRLNRLMPWVRGLRFDHLYQLIQLKMLLRLSHAQRSSAVVWYYRWRLVGCSVSHPLWAELSEVRVTLIAESRSGLYTRVALHLQSTLGFLLILIVRLLLQETQSLQILTVLLTLSAWNLIMILKDLLWLLCILEIKLTGDLSDYVQSA